jgi:hypothetical protein
MSIMGLVPAVILFAVSLVVAAFSFWWGGVVYVGTIYIALAVILISLWSVRAPADPMGARKIILSSDEELLFKKYYAFFRFPFGTQNFGYFVNYARMFGLIWIVIALWQRIYWVAIANAMFYLISSPLMWRLSPIAHYQAAAEKGLTYAAKDLRGFQHILDSRDTLGF